jgi:hypothetical protein
VIARRRVLVAHDATSTCDGLVATIERALGAVLLVDVSSFEAGRAALRSSMFSACFACLDLPPAPQGAVRLAREALRADVPLVLVTRSLRWLPADADDVRASPWVAPEATVAEVTQAVLAATGRREVDPSDTDAWGADPLPLAVGRGSR